MKDFNLKTARIPWLSGRQFLVTILLALCLGNPLYQSICLCHGGFASSVFVKALQGIFCLFEDLLLNNSC